MGYEKLSEDTENGLMQVQTLTLGWSTQLTVSYRTTYKAQEAV